MMQAKLSSQFQLSIPKQLCDRFELKAGQQFTIFTRGNIIELIPTRTIKEARGMLVHGKQMVSSNYRDRRERSSE
jgi:AbrB family looped-hinge helix DNA binding protein